MSGNDTTILRSSASPKRTSSKEASANAHVQVSNGLPMVNVTMGNGKPSQSNNMQKSNVVVFGGNGKNNRPPSNVTILDKKGSGNSVVVMAKAAPTPTLSNGALLLCKTLVTSYIAEQSQEGGDAAGAALAQLHLEELEAALNPQPKPSPAMIAHAAATGKTPSGAAGQAPRGVQRAPSSGTLPMVNVDLRAPAGPTATAASGPVVSPNGLPVIDLGDQD